MSINNDSGSQSNRRRLLKSLAAGSVLSTAKGVPGSWTRPVIESVVLPAHAQTSGCAITARCVFTDGDERAIGIFDESYHNVGKTCCDSPLQLTVDSLSPGTYIVSMGIDEGPASTTLTVTTCTGKCVVTRSISGGQGDGSGTAMVQVTLPSGQCTEINISPFPPMAMTGP
ncbi:MAG: hypothetical protein WB783_20395 [Arenicellales bacterium]